MGVKAKDIVDIIALICIPAMILFFSLLLSYLILLRIEIENIYGKVIGIYGVPIIFSLCFLPMKLTASSFKEVGICRNRKTYQDIIAIIEMIAYILLDALVIAVILFVVNYISHKMSKKGNMRTNILNSIVLVLIYLTISVGYGKISYGIQANQNLNMMSMSENQIDSVEKEEGMEIVLSDADTSSQILNYGFYLVVAFIGGQVGIRLKSKE